MPMIRPVGGPTTNAPPTFDQVNSDYQTYLGRPLTQDEYNQYWANKTDYSSGDVSNTAEAQAYRTQQATAGGGNVPGSLGAAIASGASVGAVNDPSGIGDTSHGGSLAPFDQASADPTPAASSGGGGTAAAAAPPAVATTAPLTPQVGPPSGANPGAPTPDLPTYTPPPAFSYAAYTAATPFSYADFTAPDPQTLATDPWTQYTLQTQQDAIQKSAAAKGILNTGGTVNDLLQNAQAIDTQGYQNIYNNALQAYGTNRGNAFDTYNANEANRYQDYTSARQNAVDAYNTNYQTQYVDPYKNTYTAAQDTYNAAAHNFDQGQYYAQHNIDQNAQYNWNNILFGYQQQQDQWNNKFKLLGLV